MCEREKGKSGDWIYLAMKLIALPLAPYNTPHTHTRTAEDEGRSCHATCRKVIALLRSCVPFLISFHYIYHNVRLCSLHLLTLCSKHKKIIHLQTATLNKWSIIEVMQQVKSSLLAQKVKMLINVTVTARTYLRFTVQLCGPMRFHCGRGFT